MLNVGLIGCGRVSQRYVDVFREELRNAEVTAVCDPVREKADKVAKALEARAFTRYEDLLNDSDCDALIILTESGRHTIDSAKALESGYHVIVEKPAAMFPEEILTNAKFAAKKDLMFAPILQNRFNPAMRALKAATDEKRFGKHVLATVRLRWCRYQDYYNDGWHGTWSMDGGVINQQALHHIDALRWIAGPATRVVASQTQALNNLEAEDLTVAICDFESGARGVVEATTACRPRDFEASLTLIGEKGMVEIGGIALNKVVKWEFVEPMPGDESATERFSQEVPTGYGLSHGPLLKEIFDRIESGNIVPPITALDATHAIELIHAMYKSVETNGWALIKENPRSSRLGKSVNNHKD